MKIGYKSFIHFPPTHLPPNTSESECTSQQLTIMKDLWVPDPKVFLDLAEQLDSMRTASPQPEGGISGSGDKDDSKDETPKKRSVNVKDGSEKRPHKSCEDKNWLRHSSADKSPALTSHEAGTALDASRLGTVVTQACFSAAQITKVVEDNHNSKVVDALLAKQWLEKASAEAIDSAMGEI